MAKDPNYFETPKGTILPFMDLKGKKYLAVPHRVLWFREEHPDWTIKTNIHTLNADIAIVECEIIDNNDRTLSNARKMQTAKGFPAYMEKAETGAVGRALSFLGYGTQFAIELEDDEPADIDDEDPNDLSTLSDSPIDPKKTIDVSIPKPKSANAAQPQSKGEITFGQFKGKNFADIPTKELISYSKYLTSTSKEQNKPLLGAALDFVRKVDSIMKLKEIEGVKKEIKQIHAERKSESAKAEQQTLIDKLEF